ncbi:hypothetical protein [Phenylobacterium soli]|uniref:Porin n=1 Tax=Phenylobacterium soli TaxID=2170551 RepID=A0A328ALZ5_9CAUL|nr:hypothetical protein [Phenylobacterium soli]RAK55993.1 hypothetical protein DJ017_16475 [Phenylobacterium soli]
MNKKMSLLTGAALGVFLAAGATAQADAKTKAKPHHAPAESLAAKQAQEIELLKAQVESLSERLLAIDQQQAQVKAQADQAQAAAQAAQAETAAQIKTIPATVKTQVAAALPKPKPSWADSTQVSGRMYFNLSNIEQKSNGAKVAPSGTGFDIKRFYVGIDHKFNDTFSGNITTDMNYVSNDGETQVYIKKAYLQAKLSDAAIIRVGSADLPWVPFAEDVYGYRFIENTVADRTKFGTSADWGVHASGKLMDGKLGYAVAMINGNGYKNPSRAKSVDFEGRVNLNIDKAVFAVGGYTGKLGKEVTGGVATPHTATRVNALAAWVDKKYRVGVEYFSAKDWNNVTTAAEDKADGYSVFGSYSFTPEISAFGRWDRVKPSKTLKASEKDNYFNLGLNWEPTKIVDLALVYKRDKVDNGLLSTSNGTIGGSNSGTYDEVGLFGQFRW